MNADDHTVLVLPSDSSFDVYPENKIGNFKVKLDHPLLLPGGGGALEMAVTDLFYPTRWFNVLEGEGCFGYEVTGGNPYTHCRQQVAPAGCYGSPQELLALAKFMGDTEDGEDRGEPHKHQVKPGGMVLKEGFFGMTLWEGWMMGVSIPQGVADLLTGGVTLVASNGDRRGYSVQKITPSQTRFDFDRPVDPLGNGHHLLTVSCPDVIRPVWSVTEEGCKERPWLQQFVPEPMSVGPPMHSTTGEKLEPVVKQHHRIFLQPKYCALKENLRELKEIRLQILDQKERPIRFTGGKVVTVLAVRRRRHTTER